MSRNARGEALVRRQQNCTYCLVSVPMALRTVDHEPPRSRADHPDGLGTYRLLMACRDCNELKGARTEAEFRAWLETPSGARWLRLRQEEATTGRVSSERLAVDGSRGRQALLMTRRAEQATRRRRFRAMRLHGWSDDEIKKRWSAGD